MYFLLYFLIFFWVWLIHYNYQNLKKLIEKKQFHHKPTTSFNPNSTIKTRIFLMPIVFRIAFSSLHLWLSTILNNILLISDISTLKLWGDNIKVQNFIHNFHQIFEIFLQFSDLENTDLPDIHQQIINSVELECQLPPANVVILKAENKPS